MIIKLAGCILLNDRHQIGLLHRNKNGITQWELPGGKIEQNEAAEAAAKRELKEELGIDVRIVKRVGEAEFESGDMSYHYTWFLANIQNGTPTICEPETFDQFQYFDFSELHALELSGNMQQLLKQLDDKTIDLFK